jgi:hypothetical protein
MTTPINIFRHFPFKNRFTGLTLKYNNLYACLQVINSYIILCTVLIYDRRNTCANCCRVYMTKPRAMISYTFTGLIQYISVYYYNLDARK